MDIENRRLILRAGIPAIAIGTYKMFSPEAAFAQNRGSQPRTELPTPTPSSDIPAPKPLTLISNPAALAYVALESTLVIGLATVLIRFAGGTKKR